MVFINIIPMLGLIKQKTEEMGLEIMALVVLLFLLNCGIYIKNILLKYIQTRKFWMNLA